MTRSAGLRLSLYFLAAYTVGNGLVHLREWLNGYDRIPTVVPGWWVVRVGFPVNTATSVVIAAALLFAVRRHAWTRVAVGLALFFNAATLALVIATRTSSVFGWAEPAWTDGANLTRALTLGAIAMSAITVYGATSRPKTPLARYNALFGARNQI